MSELRIALASAAATRHACEEWHYAKCIPWGRKVQLGVWEDDVFKGVVVFSRGASPWLGHDWDLDNFEICELTRVALREHETPVSRIVSIALRILKKTSPGLRLVVSFADPARDHVGAIYQAGNWVYTGKSNDVVEHLVDGVWHHTRGFYHVQKGRDDIEHRVMPGKYRYVYPLDDEMRLLVELRRLPYPKKVELDVVLAEE